ncbi:diphthine synthase [Candidatus Woesearchaeota archaeon]|jgi:diphthine synthase|nr:diphthine synthase [Candidatus Woesearchaeota archaeon]MBT6023063.1 diphthine synthase [Candidatus Woesearchaeota archaeon]
MLNIVGLGLSLKDISVKGIEAINKSDEVYIESYTSLSDYTIKELEEFLKTKIKVLHRSEVEEEKPFFQKDKEITLLIYGDPLSATTHTEILQEAKKKNIQTKIIQSVSIFTAIARTGLQLYKFGKTASIPFWTENHKPESFFDLLEQNQSIGAHTLFLLDLDPKENKFLSIKEALKIIQEISKKRNFKLGKAIGCSRLGLESEVIKYDSIKNLQNQDFGNAPYCIIIPGELNFSEEDFIANY